MDQRKISSNSFLIVSIFVLAVPLDFCNSGKISAGLSTIQLDDYRFGLGTPYVTLYQNENFRGHQHYLRLDLHCANVESDYDDWASSINLNKRCVTVCEHRDCEGKCAKLVPSMDPTVKGVMKLKDYGLNDKISSVKFCYN